MNDLASKLRKLAEFDESAAKARGKQSAPVSVDSGMDEQTAYIYGWLHGAGERDQELQPLLEALIECAGDMEWLFDNWGASNSAIKAKGYSVTSIALARLQTLVDGGEK